MHAEKTWRLRFKTMVVASVGMFVLCFIDVDDASVESWPVTLWRMVPRLVNVVVVGLYCRTFAVREARAMTQSYRLHAFRPAGRLPEAPHQPRLRS